MKTVSIVNQKGGCGKTTVAVNLAINLAYENNSVVLLDTDPQLSATETVESGNETVISVVPVKNNVHRIIGEYADYDYVVIDSPPHDSKVARSVVICSDLVIIPVQDSPLDIRSAGKTVSLVSEAQSANPAIKVCFLASRIQKNTILARDLKKHLRKIYRGIPILKTCIDNRVCYKQSFIYGLAVTEYDKLGAASAEVNELTAEVVKLLKNPEKH